MSVFSFLPALLGVFGLYCAYLMYGIVKNAPAGSGKVIDIGDQIHLGAMVFMRAEYNRLAIFCTVVILAIWISDLGGATAFAFLLGALCSGAAGYIGIRFCINKICDFINAFDTNQC